MGCSNRSQQLQQQFAGALVWAGPLVTASCSASLLLNCILAVCVHLRRRTRAIKSIGQLVINQVLLGSSFQLLSHIISAWLTGSAGCHLSHWFFHLGSLLVYADIGLHCWRVAVIMDFGRLRRTHVSDAHVMKRLSCLAGLWTGVLTAATALSLTGRLPWFETDSIGHQRCFHGAIDGCLSAGHLIAVLWSLRQAHNSRVAPDCYNTSLKSAVCLYNFALGWPALYAVCLMTRQTGMPADYAKMAAFLFTELVVTSVQLVFVLQQLLQIRSGYEEISIPVSDIAGGSATHRVDVCVSNSGRIVSMKCVPCGQLVLSPFHEHQRLHHQQQQQPQQQQQQPLAVETAAVGIQEPSGTHVEVFKGYTEEEFDRLVDMFQQLKTENLHLCKRLETMRCAQRSLSIGGGGRRSTASLYLSGAGAKNASQWDSSDTLNTALSGAGESCEALADEDFDDDSAVSAVFAGTAASAAGPPAGRRRAAMPKSVSFPTGNPAATSCGGGDSACCRQLPPIPERRCLQSREQFF